MTDSVAISIENKKTKLREIFVIQGGFDGTKHFNDVLDRTIDTLDEYDKRTIQFHQVIPLNSVYEQDPKLVKIQHHEGI